MVAEIEGDERLFDGNAGERRLKIGKIGSEFSLTGIGDRPRAGQRRQNETAARIVGVARAVHHLHLGIDGGERCAVARLGAGLHRLVCARQAAQPATGIGGEARLAVLAVINNVNSDLGLTPHHVTDRA